ncbi:hypothetical protein [[Flexibacter] sp. ATCC 35103]|uniref:hypothetical protein n=1 Tax=[Flexibacter] sp. ATCC 35103 TaxID=1937528 RepID=UPI0009CEC8C0|nr:hypothetical protein [[Flexibacter] sp. ATCC 35103]OMQ10030.1 hypothetical protein BXU01_16850 [[Flexibacter] sp. ATCC 35103]
MINEREKRKRIFYVPGMISLVFIPLFCFYHFYKVDAFKDIRTIDVHFPEDSITKEYLLSKKRNYQFFNFNNSENLENKNLKNLQITLRKLNRVNDTINGVQIHLGNKMTYDVYIKILDVFMIEGISTYLKYNDDFFVLMLPKPKVNKNSPKIVPINCGYWEANKDYFLKMEREQQLKDLLSLYKKYKILFMGYIAIVFLNIFALVKFNKTR